MQEILASLTWKELAGTLIRNSEHHNPTDRPNKWPRERDWTSSKVVKVQTLAVEDGCSS